MYIYYWSTTGPRGISYIHIPTSRKFDGRKIPEFKVYGFASIARQNWIEEGIKQGVKNRHKRRIEGIFYVNIETGERKQVYGIKE